MTQEIVFRCAATATAPSSVSRAPGIEPSHNANLYNNNGCIFDSHSMSNSHLSFRAPAEFAAQTKALAQAFNMSSSDYVREAVR